MTSGFANDFLQFYEVFLTITFVIYLALIYKKLINKMMRLASNMRYKKNANTKKYWHYFMFYLTKVMNNEGNKLT